MIGKNLAKRQIFPIFAPAKAKRLDDGVMVTLQVLVLSVPVRIRVVQPTVTSYLLLLTSHLFENIVAGIGLPRTDVGP